MAFAPPNPLPQPRLRVVRGPACCTDPPSLGDRVRAARARYVRAAEHAAALQDMPVGGVLHAELGSRSVVQDVPVAPAPPFWGLAPAEVVARLAAGREDPGLADVLAAVRVWIEGSADAARALCRGEEAGDEGGDEVSGAVDAIIFLVEAAGFAMLPNRTPPLEPPSPEPMPLAVSVRNCLDPTLTAAHPTVRMRLSSREFASGPPFYYPYVFVATRGTGVARRSGQLIPQKLRAVEQTYLGWLSAPFSLILAPVRRLLFKSARPTNSNSVAHGARISREMTSAGNHKLVESKPRLAHVRRVVPAGRIQGGWKGLADYFLPIFTQEPTHELMLLLYRAVEPNRKEMKKERREAILRQMKDSLLQAVNPVPRYRADPGEDFSTDEAKPVDASVYLKPTGTPSRPRLEVYSAVQWDCLFHFFPKTSTFIKPATRDLIRVDFLTLAGLLSALVTYVRDADSIFVWGSLAGSLLSYSLRVGFGLRQALVQYQGRVDSDKANSLLGRDAGAVAFLASLASDEQFVDAACVWYATFLDDGLTPEQLQLERFGKTTLTNPKIRAWTSRLQGWGCIDQSGSAITSTRQ